jgi:hypothetical protein
VVIKVDGLTNPGKGTKLFACTAELSYIQHKGKIKILIRDIAADQISTGQKAVQFRHRVSQMHYHLLADRLQKCSKPQ